MGRKVRIISCPTQYDDFNAGLWWQSREDLKQGALEYLKLVYLREQFEVYVEPLMHIRDALKIVCNFDFDERNFSIGIGKAV